MPVDQRDRAFADFARRERPFLSGVAFLLLGDVAHADQATEYVLAHAYARWSRLADPRLEAVRLLVHRDPVGLRLPWRPAERFELNDRTADGGRTGLVAALDRLPAEDRTAYVLTGAAGLSLEQAATVTGRDPEQVAAAARRGLAALVADRPERARPGVLTAELRATVPRPAAPTDGAEDLLSGRRLVARRRWSRLLVGVAVLVVVVLGLSQLVRAPADVPLVLPTASSTPAPARPSCPTAQPACQAALLRDWRSAVADVTSTYLDPDHRYFSGYSFSYDERYETPGFWNGRSGALALDLFRLHGGATEVYVQIATSRPYAVRCGTTTGNRCVSQRFMDGNRFTLSDSTTVAEGMEVQYCPSGDEVITVVVRNRTGGRVLDVSRGDMIRLVQDPRLHLPPR